KLALELAASVANVRGIVDRLRVAPGERRGDGAIRDSLARRLLEQPEFRTCTLRSHTHERMEVLREGNHDNPVGDIELSVADGSVPNDEQKRRAEMDAWYLSGVDRVINKLQIAA